MVHIKCIELTNFKSFGGTTKIPILPGFTVVSGPNGSGKSNILDALLFCLGLASSKGMRADRLPDLINHKYNNGSKNKSAEMMVSVTFDLADWEGFNNVEINSFNSVGEDIVNGKIIEINNGEGNIDRLEEEINLDSNILTQEKIIDPEDEIEIEEVVENTEDNSSRILRLTKEWKVSRRLRVSKKGNGNYTSTYYMNGEVCTAGEIHENLQKLRIYPEGYNVVLQGDVTRIISMNSRERREIIDELAGVAAFDRKIDRARQTLEKVKEREEHCQIIERELISSRDRLADDRIKAQKYQRLKEKVQKYKQQEVILFWRSLVQQKEELEVTVEEGNNKIKFLKDELNNIEGEILSNTNSLEELNDRVKSLGEEEQLSVASQLATDKAKRSQLQQQQIELESKGKEEKLGLTETQNNRENYQQELKKLIETKIPLETETIIDLSQQCELERNALNNIRSIADGIAEKSEAWVQEQAKLTRQVSEIQNTLNPQLTERATITEKLSQLENKISEDTELLNSTEAELNNKQTSFNTLSQEVKDREGKISYLTEDLSSKERELSVDRDTQERLVLEQTSKQRELDKLEAKKQVQQEVQGTYASKAIINAKLPGVHGLVVQLGEVEPQYRLALETAAGGRLGFLVVENENVAATGIELLKQQRAGRATFLPLNKIQSPRKLDLSPLLYSQGFIDLAVNLINCESRYKRIFAYVFGNTVVFDNLNNARSQLGQYRIVTKDGDILETSGAMTGGSKSTRSSLHFGKVATGESREIETLKERLTEIDGILSKHNKKLTERSNAIESLSGELSESKQIYREQKLRLEQLEKDIDRLTSQRDNLIQQLNNNRSLITEIQSRSQVLTESIPLQENKIRELQNKLQELEDSHDGSQWQQVQIEIKNKEVNLQDKELKLRSAENQVKDLDNRQQRLNEKIEEADGQIKSLLLDISAIEDKQSTIKNNLAEINEKITTGETELAKLNEKLGETRQERDTVEAKLKNLQTKQQKKSWQKEKLEETQQERNNTLENLEREIEQRELDLQERIESESINNSLINLDSENSISIQESSNNLEKNNDIENHLEENIKNITNIKQHIELLWSQLYTELFDLKKEETPTLTHYLLQEKLETLQKEIRKGEKKLEAMEPVNMLALEEYEKTETRLQELSEKINTIAAERTELLLRVEKFTTLRFRAFKEAYDAVDKNFQIIFAELSDGDGHLQLEDPEDPFNGGLLLVAHPKGKPVQRLSSMSGGEKSLTALSFIFSLQKYRPSPFYAFDEVDMFLDGANVEKLSRMVKKQAQQAQFIVVSLRRPMIEASERTIGVTQARGAHTQVLGIKL